ncbi:hypothetical protein CXB51_002848 [Gossypium anomalum]|uniref:RNase H type-1 domain-containing protein n=1 Tax=Gossypium anomalum TaxID=47600 RepID=A0A8J5ZHX4_9ROSI|nr:hypothetical protein CXB51_002848 [Gossypium anomalum]
MEPMGDNQTLGILSQAFLFGAAAAGGVLRDKNGEWILGYNNLEAIKAIHGCALKTSHSALIRRIHRHPIPRKQLAPTLHSQGAKLKC